MAIARIKSFRTPEMTVDELTEKVLERFPQERMDSIREQFGTWKWEKFFDRETYARSGSAKAFELGLSNCPSKCVLDIGAGLGYFSTAAMLLGHHSAVIEVSHPVTSAIYGTQYFESKRKKELHLSYALYTLLPHCRLFEPPSCKSPYDLITIMGVNLVRPDKRWWDREDYQFLVEDLVARLGKNGLLHIEFNRGPENEFLKSIHWGHRFERNDNVIRIFA